MLTVPVKKESEKIEWNVLLPVTVLLCGVQNKALTSQGRPACCSVLFHHNFKYHALFAMGTFPLSAVKTLHIICSLLVLIVKCGMNCRMAKECFPRLPECPTDGSVNHSISTGPPVTELFLHVHGDSETTYLWEERIYNTNLMSSCHCSHRSLSRFRLE